MCHYLRLSRLINVMSLRGHFCLKDYLLNFYRKSAAYLIIAGFPVLSFPIPASPDNPFQQDKKSPELAPVPNERNRVCCKIIFRTRGIKGIFIVFRKGLYRGGELWSFKAIRSWIGPAVKAIKGTVIIAWLY